MDTLRERLLDLATEAPTVEGVPPALPGRARRRIARNVAVGVAVIGLVLAGSMEALRAGDRPKPVPAIPAPSAPLPRDVAVARAWFAGAQGQIVGNVGTTGRLTSIDPSERSSPVTLTGAGIPLSWSADGRRMLLAAPEGLVVLDEDGTRTTALGGARGGPGSLSPNGSRVVYEDQGSLFIVPSTGGQPRLFLRGGGGRASLHGPSWSPDGMSIAFVATGPGRNEASISVVGADGTDPRVLVDLSGERYTELGWISWSPDGSRVAFAVNRCKLCARIYTVGADGSGLSQLTHRDSVSPTWSPNGDQIAFVADGGIWLIAPDGTNAFPLDGPQVFSNIVWSPLTRHRPP